jgi:prevent-host-death family protein
MSWQLQEAKQKFSEVVRLAMEDGPQTVTRHGHEAVVVVAAEDFHRMNQRLDFKEFLRSAPDLDLLDLERDQSMPRDLDLT